jgi:hypothetical protein
MFLESVRDDQEGQVLIGSRVTSNHFSKNFERFAGDVSEGTADRAGLPDGYVLEGKPSTKSDQRIQDFVAEGGGQSGFAGADGGQRSLQARPPCGNYAVFFRIKCSDAANRKAITPFVKGIGVIKAAGSK